jgi:4-amino-4-deoxy-L-arabinose transferase-like glycosyltransferase
MDAVLALDGKVPAVDYRARQPLYTYAIAGVFKLFGTNYVSGRLLPLACSMLAGFLIFLMARILFDEKVALLSATTYWMLPLELMNSVVVKTEPLVTLLICLSFYAVIQFSQKGQNLWLIGAGIFGAMSFYVRQSGLIVPSVVFFYLYFINKGRVLDTAKCFCFFLVGYIGMNVLVFAYYFRFMSLSELLATGMTPIGFIGSAVERLLSLGEVSLGYAQTPSSQGFHISWRLYLSYVIQAFYLHSFLLVALLLSIVTSSRHFFFKNRQDTSSEQIGSHSILYLWMLFIFLAYAYYYHSRGFFIDYFREFLPPLVIVFSAWICNSVSALKKDNAMEGFIFGGISLLAILFFVHSHYKISFGMDLYAVYTFIGIAVFIFFSSVRTFQSSGRRLIFISALLIIGISILVLYQTLLKSNLGGAFEAAPSLIAIAITFGTTWVLLDSKITRSLTRFAKLASSSVVFGTFLASVSYSGTLLNIKYDSVWSPESVEKTTEYLKRQTDAADEVMSGAVIWELQANRRPFNLISHPLRFLYGIEDQERADIIHHIKLQPPKVIILDGYTEKTYIKYIPLLNEILMKRYELKMTAGPAKYPIRLFKLKDAPAVSRACSNVS